MVGIGWIAIRIFQCGRSDIRNRYDSFGWIGMRMYIVHMQHRHDNDREIDIFIFHDYRSNEN